MDAWFYTTTSPLDEIMMGEIGELASVKSIIEADVDGMLNARAEEVLEQLKTYAQASGLDASVFDNSDYQQTVKANLLITLEAIRLEGRLEAQSEELARLFKQREESS